MKITSKGQLTIPKRIRQKFGIGPSTEIDVVEEGNTIRLVKRGRGGNPIEQVYGLLQRPKSTDRLIEQLRGR